MMRLFAITVLSFAAVVSAADPKPLADFENADVMDRVVVLDSRVERVDADGDGDHELMVAFGADRPYPNARLKPPDGVWDLAAFTHVAMEVTNLSDESVGLGCRIDNPGATGRKNSTTGGIELDPGETGTLVVRFNRRFAEDLRDKMPGMDYSPWGKRGNMIDPAKIVEINLFLNKPTKPHTFLVDDIRAAGEFDPADLTVPEPFFPFVDKFGQYTHADWPEKVHDASDLQAARKTEQQRLTDNPRPASWNKYGGWAEGPKLEATGHFRTARHQGKWHLVDPDGRLFFSIGMDVVKAGGATPIENRREDWFRNPPWENEPELGDHLGTGKARRDAYKGQELKTFSFYTANLERKYGEDWYEQWLDLTPRRLMNWGFNTIGNWSDATLFKETTIPYTHWVHYWAKKLPWQPGTRNAVPDPFDADFEENLRRRAENFTRGTIDDPYCIGYFVDNELSWGDETYLAIGVWKVNGEDQPAKRQLVEDLKAKYGDIADLRAAWKMWIESWDAALGAQERLPQTTEAMKDLKEFNGKLVRTYFKKVRGVMKEVAPNKLYLGCRFAESNPQVVEAAAQFCDVVSFNLYRGTIAAWRPPAEIDKPVIVGEFHFGATDSGVFGPGLRRADSQADRARLFRQYVTGAAANPDIVGVHWFKLTDEPVSGRVGDGENHNIGFLTITDTPYIKMTETSRDVARDIYRLRTQSNDTAGRKD